MIRLENVHVRFGDLHVLRGLDIHVAEGESVVLFGPSGCGKSTVLKLCEGLVTPDSGRVLIDGKDLTTLNEREMNAMRQESGMLFQYNALFDSMTIEQNVAFALREHRLATEKEILERTNRYLEMVNLTGVNALRPSELSGGMQKRVGIIRALIHHPRIVYYDSPTDGLDPLTADIINEMILQLNQEHGLTCLAISNDMATAYKLADRMGMMHQGRVIACGTPDEIRASRDPYVVQFINGLDEGPISDEPIDE